jgi:putative peptidoglycan lipid II flippase
MQPKGSRHLFLAGFRVTSLGILASRVLGMLRDMATASLLGMSGSGVMDAFVVAFRLPNLFRRLFGEGALATSYLPVFTAQWERSPRLAWQLASVLLSLLTALLALIVVVGEVCLGWWMRQGEAAAGDRLLLGLSAVMLPYLIFICLAAQVSATLHAVGHFAAPALAPILLNVCWLAAAWWLAPLWSDEPATQAYVIAWSVVVAGAAQLLVQLPALRRYGARFDWNWGASREAVGEVAIATLPMLLGLAVTQINTFLDSVIAWSFTLKDPAQPLIAWTGDRLRYPLEQGAASALYLGERMYQFPQGLLGIAIATAIFPLLSRHAARGDRAQLTDDLCLGLRVTLFIALPASAGLVLLAEPITRLLFEHGQFTASDTLRTARMIAIYGSAVWAYCAAPVMVRGYYALGDRQTPVRIGMACVGLDLVLNVLLIWPLAEAGMALSTALVSCLQLAVLMALFTRNDHRLDWRGLGQTAWKSCAATAVMGLASGLTLWGLRSAGGWSEAWLVGAPLLVGVALFGMAAWWLEQEELGMLWGRSGPQKTAGREEPTERPT